ncbi:MAG: hypothetical protein IKL22_08615 [Lachnospiraceae bacterium]|nr:hypothetical protein [Lachnospiraceae bacterium]
MDFRHRILPFYMTYPEVTGRTYEQDRDVMRDLEYLQQLYPLEVKYFQRRVGEILDRMDYEGSIIYDEYPDRLGLERLLESIWTIIKKEEWEGESDISDSAETWEWIKALLFVLLNTEIYKRRNGNRRRFPRLY